VAVRDEVARQAARLPLLGALGEAADDGFIHLREPCAKGAGRLAGASRVRHNRCGFTEVAMVSVGELGGRHQLRLHMVRTLAKDVQRGRAAPRWPPKGPMRRERALERAMKREEAGFEAL